VIDHKTVLTPEKIHHSLDARKGMLCKLSINQVHYPKVAILSSASRIVQSAAVHCQKFALPADTDLPVLPVNHC
jgi:hypothetical protein